MTVHLTVHVAWWVTPYLFAVTVFLRSIAPFLDGDDDRIDHFIERQGAFIAKRGVRFYCGERRI
ncbi:hypothetical protein [Aminobacter sp. MSH1]|uniref:hypothetical protein n=1 Tax=Aminobacter sp. MSH1 TaxID=374606 RepID=UPI00131EFBD4|nr:hypothetical protein [Aminobacter sp. MSH1]